MACLAGRLLASVTREGACCETACLPASNVMVFHHMHGLFSRGLVSFTQSCNLTNLPYYPECMRRDEVQCILFAPLHMLL